MTRERDCLNGDKCLFDKPIYQGDGDKCQGPLTQHHVLYECEGGKANLGNLVCMCRHHQDWVHAKNVWGEENFDELIPKKKGHKKHGK